MGGEGKQREKFHYIQDAQSSWSNLLTKAWMVTTIESNKNEEEKQTKETLHSQFAIKLAIACDIVVGRRASNKGKFLSTFTDHTTFGC